MKQTKEQIAKQMLKLGISVTAINNWLNSITETEEAINHIHRVPIGSYEFTGSQKPDTPDFVY